MARVSRRWADFDHFYGSSGVTTIENFRPTFILNLVRAALTRFDCMHRLNSPISFRRDGFSGLKG